MLTWTPTLTTGVIWTRSYSLATITDKTKKPDAADVSPPAKKQKTKHRVQADEMPSSVEVDNTQSGPLRDVGASQIKQDSVNEQDEEAEDAEAEDEDSGDKEDGDDEENSDYDVSSENV